MELGLRWGWGLSCGSTQAKEVGSNGSFKVKKVDIPNKFKKPETPKKKSSPKKTKTKPAKKQAVKKCIEASCKEDTKEDNQESCRQETSSKEASKICDLQFRRECKHRFQPIRIEI